MNNLLIIILFDKSTKIRKNEILTSNIWNRQLVDVWRFVVCLSTTKAFAFAKNDKDKAKTKSLAKLWQNSDDLRNQKRYSNVRENSFRKWSEYDRL